MVPPPWSSTNALPITSKDAGPAVSGGFPVRSRTMNHGSRSSSAGVGNVSQSRHTMVTPAERNTSSVSAFALATIDSRTPSKLHTATFICWLAVSSSTEHRAVISSVLIWAPPRKPHPGCLTGLGECIVGQVVNLRRIGNPPVEACIRPSAGGLTNPLQDAILPHKSLLPNTPPIRLSTPPSRGRLFRPYSRYTSPTDTIRREKNGLAGFLADYWPAAPLGSRGGGMSERAGSPGGTGAAPHRPLPDRKSTRLNSSHR